MKNFNLKINVDMSKTRQKKIVVSGVTRDEFEQKFADFAAADAKMQHITEKMDVDITRIREKYQDQLAELQEKKAQAFEVMNVFALENKDEIFSKKKSLETMYGVVGFRTGTPKLKTLKGFTWSAVTNLLKEFMPGYVRTSEEPAKDKLIADRELPEIAEQFIKVGIEVVQDETFYVEPKKELLEV
jgi:phage host-nuclease inhibitor protein Gam